jgi:DNA-binding ferritin-like protein
MDPVLNLSAFGEVIPGKKKETEDITFGSFMKDKGKEMDRTANPGDLIAHKALLHIPQLKLFHWQTHSFAEHKALDDAFEELIDLTDGLMESTMGKYGRPKLSSSTAMNLTNYSENSPCSGYLQEMRNCYSQEIRSMLSSEKDSELLNIVDEIVALFDKTIYLLTLK